MARKAHPNKDIEKALKYAEKKGWVVQIGASHAWGRMYCPFNDSKCQQLCQFSVWSTPRNPGTHAKRIRKSVDKCTGISAANKEVKQ